MDFQFGGQSPGFGRRKGGGQSGGRMRVERVHHPDAGFGVREMDIDQGFPPPSEIDRRAPLGDLDVAPGFQRRLAHAQACGAVALVFAVLAALAARFGRQRLPHFAEQWLGGLVQADLGMPRVMRPPINGEPLLHPTDEFGIGLGRNAPALLQPGLERFF